MERSYPAIFEKDRRTDWGVSFPDFPGCVTAASTPEEAFAMAREALQLHVDGMLEDGEDLPIPSPVESVFCWGETIVQLVPVELPGKAMRINITIPEDLLRRIEQRTNNTSAFLAEAARRFLRAG